MPELHLSDQSEPGIARRRRGRGFSYLQAVGTDAADRRQYRYHDVWSEQQDRAKFDRVLAAAARLPEIGFFRIGGESYDKDFRTWHATVLAAVGLAVSRPAALEGPAKRQRAAGLVERAVIELIRTV
ncbi:hypothetical protein [Nonomuraea sp. 10N515B]|uniref:hypothetical protein n=1 Tax=Nonomuraea sp. 10N515B TaxID=3457422 RepID=UPI003FCE7484